MRQLNVVVLKPSKYGLDGFVERFKLGFMPNSTVPFINSMIPDLIGDTSILVETIDEYVQRNLTYLYTLDAEKWGPTLLLLVGVQSHQFQRALDLAALAKKRGCMVVIGGPHPMSCDTSSLQGRGVSFALAEAELVLDTILRDAAFEGKLRPVYGQNQRWAHSINPPVLIPPAQHKLRLCIVPMLGIYPNRGCPFTCNFCSVTAIAGRRVRGQPIDTTMASIRAAKAAGVKMIMFTSDNFNKIPNVEDLLTAITEEGVCLPFFCQCDTQFANQPDLVELMAKAGCFNIFIGVESLNRKTLLAARKAQNHPEKFAEIVRLCDQWGIGAHFSNIIGFPQDTEEEVLHHLEVLKCLNPTLASFYILCPIPGTGLYDDFQKAGLISEPNLDRFDGINAVWDHPTLSKASRVRLLMRCYKEFYSVRHTLSNLKRIGKNRRFNLQRQIGATVGFAAFSRWCASKGTHPMSGGIGAVKLDHVSNYLNLRRQTYGFDLVPLAQNLPLSVTDEMQNRINLRPVLV